MIIYYNICRLYEEVVLLFSWVLEVIFFEKLILVDIEFIEDR